MLERRVSTEGVVTYISPLLRDLGVPHAFSTRIGGVSSGPFDSLNLGNPNACEIRDPSEHIRENYRRLQRACDCEGRELTWLHQVHGDRVVRLQPGRPHDNDTQADALVSDDPARAISVRVADCVPVLLSSADGKIVSAVHAGWRGVVAGVVVEAVREMTRDRALPASQLTAAIGPSIGPGAFEVGPEVLEEFIKGFGAEAPIRRRNDGKGNVDLREALRRQLVASGLTDERIDLNDRCTHRDAAEFFSHRRENGITGRMAAIIAPRPLTQHVDRA